MAIKDLDLKTLLDIPLWEKVQDELAKLTGTAIITIDFKGNPITKHSCRTDFCSVIRENPISRKRCFRCDALAGLEAVRLGGPYIYLCHCGIVDVAVPVMVGLPERVREPLFSIPIPALPVAVMLTPLSMLKDAPFWIP